MRAVDAAAPTALLSLGHGEGPPRRGWAPGERRARQGALSFGRGGRITAADLADRRFLPGGLWFLLACYGAGTPDRSGFEHWARSLKAAGAFPGSTRALLEGLPSPGDRPFVAALPKAALASSEGPLAFVGHVDLAWTYAFREQDDGVRDRASRFTAVLRSALDRRRIGVCFRELSRALGQTDSELASLYDEAEAGFPTDPVRRGHLWMLRQDLAAYVLLGDPAARLPLRAPQPAQAPADLSALLGFAPAATTTPPTDWDAIEQAIARVVLGEQSVRQIAASTGLSRSRLNRLARAWRAAGMAAVRAEEA